MQILYICPVTYYISNDEYFFQCYDFIEQWEAYHHIICVQSISLYGITVTVTDDVFGDLSVF